MTGVQTCVFFFKQKTAYEMCGRDWSSDVCSSDLFPHVPSAACGQVHTQLNLSEPSHWSRPITGGTNV